MEIQQSYYDYVLKVENGSLFIANKLREEDYESALGAIVNFSEGVEWLIKVEDAMLAQGYLIESNVKQVVLLINEINECLSCQDFATLADLFEYEIAPLFSNVANWKFCKGMD